MSKVGFLSKEEIKVNINSLKSFMKTKKLDSFYLSSSDIFLNEYVPLEECHRYYLTGFTGSTSECLVPLEGKVILFVDGRYYEQTDIECDANLVEVIKVPYGTGLRQAMKEVLTTKKLKSLGLEGDRVELSLYNDFKKISQVSAFNNSELSQILSFEQNSFDK